MRKQKNPWVAAVLNFFMPGIGFAYLGTGSCIIGGIGIFCIMLVEYIISYGEMSVGLQLAGTLLGLIAGVFFAIVGYGTTVIWNESIKVQTVPSSTPSAPEKIFCISCGVESTKDAEYCKKCGKKIAKD